MSNFETFSRHMAASLAGPHVTVHTRGAFSLNRPAFELLGGPGAVELLYDRDRDIVGMRAADPRGGEAHAVRPASSTARSGPWMVTAMKFMRYYEIDLSTTRRWEVELESDVLCIDLRTPGTPVTSNRRGTGSNGSNGSCDN